MGMVALAYDPARARWVAAVKPAARVGWMQVQIGW